MNGEAGPELVDTGKGLTVRYRDRFLYSAREPERAPSLTGGKASFLPETLVVCLSPLLGYGLREILSRLPARSFVLCVECNSELHALSESYISKDIRTDSRYKLIQIRSIADLCSEVEKLPHFPFRRCARVDLSAGSSLNETLWDDAIRAIDSTIGTYWKNRVILMRLGRNFARNLLVNARLLRRAQPLARASVAKPIFVAGAGPSLDATLAFVRTRAPSLYILAVDTALPALRAAGITPDAVVVLESQYWIERAFIGFKDSRIPVFADMTARPQAILATGGDISFFHTKYAESRFLSRFAASGVAPLEAPRLGSVGLSSLWLATNLAGQNAPIFFAGLDFSWGRGFTHSNDAVASNADRACATRLSPVGMAANSFAVGVSESEGKNGESVRTDPALSLYAALCRDALAGTRGVYDLGGTGLPTGFPAMTREEADRRITDWDNAHSARDSRSLRDAHDDAHVGELIDRFLTGEKTKLESLRATLTGKAKAENVRDSIAELDYLFLHFPDGHAGPNDSQGFLNRIRVETEYFLKALTVRALASFPSS